MVKPFEDHKVHWWHLWSLTSKELGPSNHIKQVGFVLVVQLTKLTVPIVYDVAGKRVLSPLHVRIRYPDRCLAHVCWK